MKSKFAAFTLILGLAATLGACDTGADGVGDTEAEPTPMETTTETMVVPEETMVPTTTMEPTETQVPTTTMEPTDVPSPQ